MRRAIICPVESIVAQPDLAAALDAFLRPGVRGVLRQAAELAANQGGALYLVGGTVRDMLLGRPQADLDLVVEGDAPALAAALAARLGGRTRAHPQFGTASVEWAGEPPLLDLVTARRERYPRPAALPEVAPAPLRDDLLRRDFAANALAIALDPAHYGALIDVTGGVDDLRRRELRVLHDASFVDDPTRILRGARLAARLGFAFEPRTAALLADALAQGMLERTTPQRIWNELELTLAEERPEAALALLQALGALPHLHPALRWTPEQAGRYARARGAGADVALGLLLYDLPDAEREAFVARYRLPAPLARLVRDLSAARAAAAVLHDPSLPASAIDRLLRGVDERALRAAQAAEPPAAPAIERYLGELRAIRPVLDGRYLRDLGLPPGPRYAELLDALRAARLDGRVHTREEEAAFLRERVSGRHSDPMTR